MHDVTGQTGSVGVKRPSIVGRQWGLSADSHHMEGIMGVGAEIQGLPAPSPTLVPQRFLATVS